MPEELQAAAQQVQRQLAHLGAGVALLQVLDSSLGIQGAQRFIIAAPLLGIAPDASQALRKPVDTNLANAKNTETVRV